MEQKSFLLSALSVGVGVGLGLASGQSVGKLIGSNSSLDSISAEQIESELSRLIVDGKETKVSFDEFPYYLSEQTRALLTSAAYVHLKHTDISKFTKNLSPGSRAILLSGPAELYQQLLAKALANHFDAKLLLLDVVDFSIKMQNKYGLEKKDTRRSRSISEATLSHVSSLLGSFSMFPPRDAPKGSLRRQASTTDIKSGSPAPAKHRRNASTSTDMSNVVSQTSASTSAKRTSSWSFDEKLFLQALYKVLVATSEKSPVILYIRDIERLLLQSDRIYNLFEKLLNKLEGSVLVLGSRMLDADTDYEEADEQLSALFPYNIDVRPPDDETHFVNWNTQLEEDMKTIQFQDTRNHISEVLAENDLVCDDLASICHSDTITLSNHIDEIVMSAISFHLMNNKVPEYRNGKLVISSSSLSHGLSIFQEGKQMGKPKMETNGETGKQTDDAGVVKTDGKSDTSGAENKGETGSLTKNPENAPPVKEVPPDNEFEKRIRPEVIPANEIGVTFNDIGALDDIKESLQELVMLPLRRPDLFKGGLLKPCRGVLLFGPPGTGKTMLAKAIANEAGASFINVSMSTITSKWFGEDEKNVRALFTLAAKVSPTIIFVDEVDSMLGQRTRVGEHEAMRKIKNEFMSHWDGLMTKPGEQILVLAATNRPFDLDEAIIRRFERRIMVGLPSIENREKILKTLLSKEHAENLDFHELATMTEGYTGSDLKNLCITAAYRPVRELLQRERKKDLAKKKKAQENNSDSEASTETKEAEKQEEPIVLRPLNMEDMRQAKNQVAASFASEGAVMNELKQWNELYGEGGSRKKEQLTYFL
ncbi:calmodulin-interacting protein 111-like [Amaranthus tricolor]|uniref:calmodulin-interacting protein 111-like n=1 Tax=Amaranthus tricolor TaxID=29722 RepID=UPI00258F8A49|nr:calmodulin-interacting protein 111-like [Amaranthus tricolor]